MTLTRPDHKPRGGSMSNEREQLSRAFDRSRSRLAYLNLTLTGILVIAAVLRIWLIALDY